MRLKNGDVLLFWPLSLHLITAGWTYKDGTVDWTQDWDGRTITGMMSYGTGVRIRHADYRGGMLQTRYAHLKTRVVKTGETVREGQFIGYSGVTGHCYGAHLHFEVIWRGVRRNPLAWLDGDFTCKNAEVAAHLGTYTSMVRPALPAIDWDCDRFTVTATGADKARLRALVEELSLPCIAVRE